MSIQETSYILSHSKSKLSVFSDSQIKFCEATEGDTGHMTVIKVPVCSFAIVVSQHWQVVILMAGSRITGA